MGFQDSASGTEYDANCHSNSNAARPVFSVTTISGLAENGSSPRFAHKVKKAISASVGIKGILTIPG